MTSSSCSRVNSIWRLGWDLRQMECYISHIVRRNIGQRTSRRPPTRGSVGAEAGMDPGGTLHSPRRAAIPQPPCCPAHAALYRSQIGSRTPRCQPDFQAAPRSHRTGFAADARRRGGSAWGSGRAGARRAPAAALLPRTRHTLQISLYRSECTVCIRLCSKGCASAVSPLNICMQTLFVTA